MFERRGSKRNMRTSKKNATDRLSSMWMKLTAAVLHVCMYVCRIAYHGINSQRHTYSHRVGIPAQDLPSICACTFTRARSRQVQLHMSSTSCKYATTEKSGHFFKIRPNKDPALLIGRKLPMVGITHVTPHNHRNSPALLSLCCCTVHFLPSLLQA